MMGSERKPPARSERGSAQGRAGEARLVAAVRAGDEAAFAALTEPYRRQLQVHCYRILGSLEDAEDLVQETFIRAWRNRASFHGESLYRTWLYQIATNASLDALRRRRRRVLPPDLGPAGDPRAELPDATDAPWLQPYPDRLLEPASPDESEPEALVVERETIELAFLVAIQALPPRQRAALILRDVLDWSAAATASLLETSVQAINSSLQRAHATMRTQLPPDRRDWGQVAAATGDEQLLLQRYMEAHERADIGGLARLLRDDVRLSMPPMPVWFEGHAAVVAFHEGVFAPEVGHIRGVPTAANRQPVAALYVRAPGEDEYRPLALDLLTIDGGAITQITSFVTPDLFAAFGLPAGFR
jgi:RNA polymerase sigma-70 factor (ECF subfamily)